MTSAAGEDEGRISTTLTPMGEQADGQMNLSVWASGEVGERIRRAIEEFAALWDQMAQGFRQLMDALAPLVEFMNVHGEDCPMIREWRAWQLAPSCHCLCGNFHELGVCTGSVHPVWAAQADTTVRVCEACRASANGWLLAVIDVEDEQERDDVLGDSAPHVDSCDADQVSADVQRAAPAAVVAGDGRSVVGGCAAF